MNVELDTNKTVMIIDDEEAYAKATAKLLQSRGFSIQIAHSAGEAIKQLESITPDLLLIDVMMPEVDGLTLMRKIKSDPKLLRTPFVVVSALGMPADRAMAWVSGADAFLEKPYRYDELMDVIHLVMS
jgi:CheY-like chemotaxis protein